MWGREATKWRKVRGRRTREAGPPGAALERWRGSDDLMTLPSPPDKTPYGLSFCYAKLKLAFRGGVTRMPQRPAGC